MALLCRMMDFVETGCMHEPTPWIREARQNLFFGCLSASFSSLHLLQICESCFHGVRECQLTHRHSTLQRIARVIISATGRLCARISKTGYLFSTVMSVVAFQGKPKSLSCQMNHLPTLSSIYFVLRQINPFVATQSTHHALNTH